MLETLQKFDKKYQLLLCINKPNSVSAGSKNVISLWMSISPAWFRLPRWLPPWQQASARLLTFEILSFYSGSLLLGLIDYSRLLLFLFDENKLFKVWIKDLCVLFDWGNLPLTIKYPQGYRWTWGSSLWPCPLNVTVFKRLTRVKSFMANFGVICHFGTQLQIGQRI